MVAKSNEEGYAEPNKASVTHTLWRTRGGTCMTRTRSNLAHSRDNMMIPNVEYNEKLRRLLGIEEPKTDIISFGAPGYFSCFIPKFSLRDWIERFPERFELSALSQPLTKALLATKPQDGVYQITETFSETIFGGREKSVENIQEENILAEIPLLTGVWILQKELNGIDLFHFLPQAPFSEVWTGVSLGHGKYLTMLSESEGDKLVFIERTIEPHVNYQNIGVLRYKKR